MPSLVPIQATLAPVSGPAASLRARVETGAPAFKLIRENAECNSEDSKFGDAGAYADAASCAAACDSREGCEYFIFGTGNKAGACYAEMTESNDCPEGWEEDEFDFYEIEPRPWAQANKQGALVIDAGKCTKPPCTVMLKVDGAPEGGDTSATLRILEWSPGGGGGGGGGTLVFLLLVLLAGGVYAFLVHRGQRSAEADWAAVKGAVEAAADKVSALRAQGMQAVRKSGRSRVASTDTMTAPLNAPLSNVVVLTPD